MSHNANASIDSEWNVNAKNCASAQNPSQNVIGSPNFRMETTTLLGRGKKNEKVEQTSS